MTKKILIISALDLWSLGTKTGAQSLWRTLEGYAKSGWEVYFLTSNKSGKTDLEAGSLPIVVERFDFSLLKNLAKLKFLGLFFRSLGWIYFQIAAIYKGYLLAHKHGINVFYGYEVHAVPAAKFLSIIFRKPVVSRFQGTLLSKYFDHPKPFWKLRNWWHILALKLKTDLVIMTNDGTRGDMVLKSLGVDPKKVRFWTNGVDRELFEFDPKTTNIKRELNLSGDDKVLLSVSRLEKWKGVDRIITALPLLLKKFPQTRLLIVGDGSERRNLETMVDNLNLRKNVKFLGAVEHDLLPAYYKLADIFVSMYDISNVGNPLFEAMVAGKCILTLDVGDTDKFIKEQETGILVKDPLPQTIADKLFELLERPESISRLGKNAAKSAQIHLWTWETRMETEVREVGSLVGKN